MLGNSGSLGSSYADLSYYSPFAGGNRQRRTNRDCVTCSTTREGLAHDTNVQSAITHPESGSYVPFDVLSTGASGSKDYDRAMLESEMARNNPTMLAMSTSKDMDVSWHEPIVPRKPKPVELAGMSVFGTGGPTSTSRGMTTDFRGEAVSQYAVGPPPEGASISGRMGTMTNEKERLNQRGIPAELQRCYGDPSCVRRSNTREYIRNRLGDTMNGFMLGFTAL